MKLTDKQKKQNKVYSIHYKDPKGRIKNLEVEFSYPIEHEETALVSIARWFFQDDIYRPHIYSKEELMHRVEQFLLNNPEIKAVHRIRRVERG